MPVRLPPPWLSEHTEEVSEEYKIIVKIKEMKWFVGVDGAGIFRRRD